MSQLVVTAVGPDRPGLVGEFTGPIFASGANLADSRMVNLRGQFAIIVLLEANETAIAQLRETLPRTAEAIGLRLTFTIPGEPSRPKAGVPYRLKTYSMDQPGIVHR